MTMSYFGIELLAAAHIADCGRTAAELARLRAVETEQCAATRRQGYGVVIAWVVAIMRRNPFAIRTEELP